MKYLILVYSNPESWEHPMFVRDPGFLGLTEAERADVVQEAEALHAEIVASGELVEGVALADPVTARTARPGAGGVTVTDGPYLETKEQLAGYFVIDCDTPARAAEIAARFPDARLTAVEVRPIMTSGGEDM
ncbi:MAG TPA: YciI family protein [Iamia sp.]|nr:YciI family protein [Iamia sp.]